MNNFFEQYVKDYNTFLSDEQFQAHLEEVAKLSSKFKSFDKEIKFLTKLQNSKKNSEQASLMYKRTLRYYVFYRLYFFCELLLRVEYSQTLEIVTSYMLRYIELLKDDSSNDEKIEKLKFLIKNLSDLSSFSMGE